MFTARVETATLNTLHHISETTVATFMQENSLTWWQKVRQSFSTYIQYLWHCCAKFSCKKSVVCITWPLICMPVHLF